MAWAGSAMSTSFKKELATATHNFTTTTGHVFKCALYDNTGLDATTTVYTDATHPANEITGTGYSAGGFAWTAAQNTTPATSGTTAYWSWSVNPSWTSATFTAYGALLYNSTQSNKAVAVLDFGGSKPVSAGTFTIILPTNDQNNAILRIA